MKFALNALPETFINMLQGFVSLRRIERYLISQEIPPAPYSEEGGPIVFNSATISWPQSRFTGSTPASVVSTPRKRFVLMDLNLDFPLGELSLICGRLGSGKTLLLLGTLRYNSSRLTPMDYYRSTW
jgi:ABC-type multidrug transport system fused ATPase/permease subunit